jgi:tripartite motif-containing protein 71
MKNLILTMALALAPAAVYAGPAWVYEGQWGRLGSGNGEFNRPYGVATAADGTVYVTDCRNDRVQYFTPTGSYLGKWGSSAELKEPYGIAVYPGDGRVYVAGGWRIKYYTSTGSFLGSWNPGDDEHHLDVSRDGYVYVDAEGWESDSYWTIKRFTLSGSLVQNFGHFKFPGGVACSPDGNYVYASSSCPQYWNDVVKYTATGSMVWGHYAFAYIIGMEAGSEGYVYCAEEGGDVLIMTSEGKYAGYIEHEFNWPSDVALSPSGDRLYVADRLNHRIQYFRPSLVTITPTSLGRVKALFK